jgi:exopolysaccharide biosynthesis polyprenyl glycosylphosphotransferase
MAAGKKASYVGSLPVPRRPLFDGRGLASTRRPRLRAASEDRSSWQRQYVRSIVLADATAALLSAVVAYLVRFGREATPQETALYAGSIVILPALWVLAMALCRTYETRFLGVGSDEYRRVAEAGMIVIAGVATMSYAFRLELARGFVVVALPLALLLTLLGRNVMRKSLHRRRARGESVQRVVAVGHGAAVEALVRRLRTNRYHGLDVVAACVPAGASDSDVEGLGVPVVGSFDSIVEAVRNSDADAVAVLPCPELDGAALRRLGWQLEDTRADLLVAPAVVEVVGPRIAIRPVCGLPLLHVERPELHGVRRAVKSFFDRVVASSALLALSPVILTLAVAIKATSRGPVLFRQTRVGRHGELFDIYKFRTMQADAEHLLIDLRDQNESNGVLFKIRHDPRVTSVGRWLRRYSVDELPQLLNVARGQMSLVGPRPPLQSEVDVYGDDMRRRLLVKPGLTGLWQINGRSDLDWDESVRLDLRYVENWSFAFDLMILWKTASAVVHGRGAY